jgi:hypothetical protein
VALDSFVSIVICIKLLPHKPPIETGTWHYTIHGKNCII